MEKICHRCQGELNTEGNYCPACGLPQILFSSDETPGPVSLQPWHQGDTDAGEVAWRPAMRIALFTAIPAGIACSMVSPIGFFKLIWMLLAAASVVALYVRRVQPPWITAGAGARIGLVSGIFTAWIAFLISSIAFFTQRFVFGNGAVIDTEWKAFVDNYQKQLLPLIPQMNPDPAALANMKDFITWMQQPNGQAGMALLELTILCFTLLLLSMLGGVIGARLSARARR
jgi:hypothetical protein